MCGFLRVFFFCPTAKENASEVDDAVEEEEEVVDDDDGVPVSNEKGLNAKLLLFCVCVSSFKVKDLHSGVSFRLGLDFLEFVA